MEKLQYPCKNCKRVCDPAACENKRCIPWQRWFLRRWRAINGYYIQKTQEMR